MEQQQIFINTVQQPNVSPTAVIVCENELNHYSDHAVFQELPIEMRLLDLKSAKYVLYDNALQ